MRHLPYRLRYLAAEPGAAVDGAGQRFCLIRPFLIVSTLVAAWLGVTCTLAPQSGPLLHGSAQNQDPLHENSVECLLLQPGRVPGWDRINPLSMGGAQGKQNPAGAHLV
jgi:hypothetical protein